MACLHTDHCENCKEVWHRMRTCPVCIQQNEARERVRPLVWGASVTSIFEDGIAKPKPTFSAHSLRKSRSSLSFDSKLRYKSMQARAGPLRVTNNQSSGGLFHEARSLGHASG